MTSDHDEPGRSAPAPIGSLRFDREARVFGTGADRIRELAGSAEILRLGTGEQLHPRPPSDLVIRQGNLRVSEQLADGREVTRAVLQTGVVCRLRELDEPDDSGATDSPLYSLAETNLVALSESEIWQLPAGACDPD